MKVVISRKGFDSQYGGMPSPVLPDGTLVPLPIPGPHDSFTFMDLNLPGVDIDRLLRDLSEGSAQPHVGTENVHLDPDLCRNPSRCLPGWRPALGQTGAAQSHLAKQGVGPGDLFLFFGWFRAVEQADGRWRFRRGAPDLHHLFGWLEIDSVLPVVGAARERERALNLHPWIADHPHVANVAHYTSERNVLYVGASRSRFADAMGGGRFSRTHPRLQLTAPNAKSRTRWLLPAAFLPSAGPVALSYHGRRERWTDTPDGALLETVQKGQEFVADTKDAPAVAEWAIGLVRDFA